MGEAKMRLRKMEHLVSAVVFIVICSGIASGQEHETEYTPFDGWYNNFAHPEWGAADTALLRLLPHAYGDGVYAPSGANRPNPIEISQVVFSGPTGMGSYRNRTALLVFYGQQMVEEILDAQRPGCPPEYFNIPVPKGHHQYDPLSKGDREIPLLRTRYDQRTGFSPNVPREQLNEVSSFFDGSLMYGPAKAWSDALRSFKDGLLLATNDTKDGSPDSFKNFPAINTIKLPFANPPPPRDHVLKPIERFFRIGNPRGNENPFLLTFGILWFRYHNFRARQLKVKHGNWSDEKLFNEARKWTIAVHQKISMYDWLPSWLSEDLPPYKGYDPNVHPQIAVVFQSAAMRFGHTLVPPGVYRRNAECRFRKTTNLTHFANREGLRTCNTFWNPQEAIRESDIDEILMGLMSQIAEREDNIITPDLRGNVFGPLEFSRRDLMAVNIQRGRDHGLPDYNTARQYFGLPRIKNWEDINLNLSIEKPEIFANLSRLYNGSLDDVDIWPAGMLETTERGPGPLFRAIILNQFERIRNGDRFWFENKKMKLFTEQEIQEIHNITLRDVILAVTDIPERSINKNVFFFRTADNDPCPQPAQLNHSNPTHLEDCTSVESFDYFSGSEVSYALSIFSLLATVFPIIGVLLYLVKNHQQQVQIAQAALRLTSRAKAPKAAVTFEPGITSIDATEWVGDKEGERNVVVEFNTVKRLIVVKEDGKTPVRTIDMSHLRPGDEIEIELSADVNLRVMLVRIPMEYDLVLTFDNPNQRQECMNKLKEFLGSVGGIPMKSPSVTSEKIIKKSALTKAKRQKILEEFFAEIFAHALKYERHSASRQSMSGRSAIDLVTCELTKAEFAEALSLRVDSMFVTNMFNMVDSNNNGYISFREFLDFFVIFAKGTAEDKARLLFDMHDLQKDGKLSKDEFKIMLRSMVEMANEKIEDNEIDTLIENLMRQAGISQKQGGITFQDFQKLMNDFQEELNYASLNIQIGDVKAPEMKGRRENATVKARRTILRAYSIEESPPKSNRLSMVKPLETIEKTSPSGPRAEKWESFLKFVENYKAQIFWLTLYTLVVFGIFIERAYYYSVEREHGGLRRIAGYGVTVTRGAASAMMFTYSCLLVTMCRNLITFLRETFMHRYVPFDEAISFHKYIAFLALLFTLIHIIGHCINFYHIATQTADDLACLFRNFFHPTDALPKFHRWCWETITGLTGVALTIHMFIIYIFGLQYARRHTYKGFWNTHNTYPIFFILMIMHGAGRLVQPPLFYYFFLGPAILFTIDLLMSISRKKIEIAVVKAELLPSDVTYLEIRKPSNFEYRSGQWVRIACLAHGKNEYHPFTLTSAPHEENLGLHIRAVGPWTSAIRKIYDPRSIMQHALPKVFLDGPYGEGHQDWCKYDVSILVGGGIGVTPFASILKDIAHKSHSGQKLACKKVYFIWVTRTQRHFEWMTDIIREVEEKDKKDIVSAHIFITQFREKFDIRTTMLYICERYFQKISDRSLFTGLRSITHFGRPNFDQIFSVLRNEHSDTSTFGVFSCGPPPMTRNVENACANRNRESASALFVHHYENF